MASDSAAIKAAVDLMDRSKDDQWEPNGFPKLEVVQTILGDDKITHDDVDEAIGAFNRKSAPKAKNKPAAPVTVPVVEAKPQEDGGTVLSENDKLLAIVEAARARHDEIKAQRDAVEDARNECIRKMEALTRLADEQILIIEQYAPRVSQAQAVKKIQEQTQARLVAQKDAALKAQAAMNITGANVYPSKLDAAMAMRKRTSEQNANYAKFVHQNSVARTAGVAA